MSTKITITHIKDYGKSHEIYCSKLLFLRHARREGDVEYVNNYQLGILRRHKGADLDFIEEKYNKANK